MWIPSSGILNWQSYSGEGHRPRQVSNLAINTKYNLLLRYKFHTFKSHAYKASNFTFLPLILPSLASWRLKDCHMRYVWYHSCLQAGEQGKPQLNIFLIKLELNKITPHFFTSKHKRGFQTFLPLRGTNLRKHRNRHFDLLLFKIFVITRCHYSTARYAGYTQTGTTIIIMVNFDLAP